MEWVVQFLSHLKTRRLLLVMGISVGFVLVMQYFELPYGDVFSPLFSSFLTGDSLSKFEKVRSNEPTKVTEKLNASSIYENDKSTPSSHTKENVSKDNGWKVDTDLASERNRSSDTSLAPVALPMSDSLHEERLKASLNGSCIERIRSKDETDMFHKGLKQCNFFASKSNYSIVSISEMNKLLLQSHLSLAPMTPQWSSAVDEEVVFAKSEINNAPVVKNDTGLHFTLYRNASMFKRSYELMEKMLKIYIYREGEKPIFNQPILEGIYATEGWFMKMLISNKKFITKDPRKAHLFYLPFSSRQLQFALYVRNSHSRDNLIQFMKNYVNMLAAKYPFWNRTGGADHFLAACHDWAPAETRGRMLNCIRALCNADINVGFSIGKDVSLPTTNIHSAQNPLKNVGGNPPSLRPTLAFFAGNIHGNVRSFLLKYWGNKDPSMKIFGPMPHVKGNANYIQDMKSSKYCICAKGFAVHSPRVMEALYYECVPVIISDNYVPPLFEVLAWESFAVFVMEKDIPNLKNILLSISEDQYLEMHTRVKKVQQHFLWHDEPVKYDSFHMILHSIWYNRIFR